MHIDREELQQMLDQAAEKAVSNALARLGLDDKYAAQNIRDMRRFVHWLNIFQKAFWQGVARAIAVTALAMLAAGFVIFTKGGGQ